MDSYYICIIILGPFTLGAMISASIYMKVQAKRLSEEIQRKGLVIYSVPIFVTGGLREENRPPLISPITGLPPPPPYSRNQPTTNQRQQINETYSNGPPPLYNNNLDPGFRVPINPPAYDDTQHQTIQINELPSRN
nr:uncharacterized protein LOC111424029 [Onthophagus taurus]